MGGFVPLAYDREPQPTTVMTFIRVTFTFITITRAGTA